MSLILFELVKSMTLNEKVYFKRNAKTHSSNEDKNYIKIYNVVEKSKVFNKSTLSNHFKGTSVEKYLSSEVSYLKEKILISLFNFNLNSTKRNQIQKGIFLVESLAAKGFQKEALKKLQTIKKKALKQEEYTWTLRLIELEEKIIFKAGILGYRDKLEELHQQRSEAINIIQNLNKYHIIREEIRELQFNKHLINEEEELKTICDNPLIVSDKECMSIKAKEHWFYIHVLISYLKWDYKEGLIVSSKYVDFINQHIHLFDHNKMLPALSNYIFHAALLGDKTHFKEGKRILINISKKKDAPVLYIKYIISTRSLEYAYNTNDKLLTQEYLKVSLDLIEHQIEEYEESQIQYFFMAIVRATISLEQYDQGAHLSNLWQRRGVLSYRKVQAKLFSIIIHFELNYLELLRSEIVLLKKLEKEFESEKVMIRLFYKFINSILKYPKRRIDFILEFQEELLAFSEANKNYFIFNSFDFYKWSLGLK